MSYEVTQKVLDTQLPEVEVYDEGKDVKVSPRTLKMFLVCLAERAWPDGTNAYPGSAELKFRMQADDATVRRCRKAALALGVIVADGYSPKSYKYTRKYRFDMDRVGQNVTYYPVVQTTTTGEYATTTTQWEVNRHNGETERPSSSAGASSSGAKKRSKQSYRATSQAETPDHTPTPSSADPLPQGCQLWTDGADIPDGYHGIFIKGKTYIVPRKIDMKFGKVEISGV